MMKLIALSILLLAFPAKAAEFPPLKAVGLNVVLVAPGLICGNAFNVPEGLLAWEKGDAAWLEELDCSVLTPDREWKAINLGSVMTWKHYPICGIRIVAPVQVSKAYAYCSSEGWKRTGN